MNSFEQFTVIIGVLAILFAAVSYVRAFLQKVFHKN